MSAKNGKSNGHKNGNGNGNGAKPEPPRDTPSLKFERWIGFFFGEADGNATEAARMARYEGSDETLRKIGHQNLHAHETRERVARIRKQADVGTEEVIGRLVSYSRADILDAFEDSDSPQIKRLREKNLGHLVRKIRIKRYTEGKGEEATPVEITELEFHNSLQATTQLCKVLGIERAPIPADNAEAVLDKATEALVLLAGVDSAQARELLQKAQKAQQVGSGLM